jgi:branched-chain amino acid transport system ATP-binding protein
MLVVQGLSAGYGPVDVLADMSLHVGEGEVVAVLGANGAGKSTLMNALVGIVAPRSGSIEFEGHQIAGWPTESIVRAGLTLVPEGRKVFARLTVAENLRMGAYGRTADDAQTDLNRLLERFAILGARQHQPAGTLSGGEQQQLAIARALMSRPKMVLLDEPSLGLAPVIVNAVFDLVRELKETDGLTVMLVEQSISHALDIASRVYVLASGNIVSEGTSKEVSAAAHELEASYLGRSS